MKIVESDYIKENSKVFIFDGDKICCHYGDFINLQESDAGFGDTADEAFADLRANTSQHTFIPAKSFAGHPDIDMCLRCHGDIRSDVHHSTKSSSNE